MKEKLSALMDAELSELEERRVLDALAQNSGLRATWERYHLMRAAICRQLDIAAPAGLADRIYARLQDAGANTARHRYYGLVGGFAAAAAIAAVTIFGLQVLQSPSSPTVPPPLAANSQPLVASSTQPQNEPLNGYLVGHNEFMPIAGMSGMLPYARMVTYDRDK